MEKHMQKIAIAFCAVIIILAIWYSFFVAERIEPNPVEVDADYHIALTADLLELMYSLTSVEQLISVNDEILNYFSNELKPSIDNRYEQNYENRYATFRNKETKITFNKIVAIETGEILAHYTINSLTNLPAERMAVVTFNEDNIIIGFDEYRIYDVREGY